MTLDELKAAMDEAAAKAAADPTNAELKAAAEAAVKAYDDAKAIEDAKGGGGSPDDFDETKADEKTKAYIAKLRKENAGHRTKAKDLASQLKSEAEKRKAILKAAGITTEEEKPEELLKVSEAEKQQLAFRNAIMELALDHGIPKASVEYFEFLVTKATSALADGEELDDAELAKIVAQAKKFGSSGSANSTVGAGGTGAGGGGSAPNPAGDKTITLEKFCSMSITEKSKLYTTNPDLYSALVAEAKAKKKLV